jgi:hypothetical protein
MESTTRRKLAEFIRSEGLSLADDPQRVKALLLDTCPEAKTEISLLTLAVEDDIPLRLIRSSSDAVMKDGAIARAVADLQSLRRVDRAAAQWVVGSWAWALGLSGTEPEDNVGNDPVAGGQPTIPSNGHQVPEPHPASSDGTSYNPPDHGSPGYSPPGFGPPAPPANPNGATNGPPPSWPSDTASSTPSFGSVESKMPSPPAPPAWPPPPQRSAGTSRGLIAAVVGGVILIVGVGLGLKAMSSNAAAPTPTPTSSTQASPSPTPSAPASVPFTIADGLANWETSETLIVYFDGRNDGTMRIDQGAPNAQLSLTGTPGSYDYELDATYTYTDANGIVQENRVTGHGTLDISANVTFDVNLVGSGANAQYTLQEAS